MVARSGDETQPPRRTLILVATIIGSSITFVDGTVVNIALPTIGRDLDAGLSSQQWVTLSYSLAVASLYIVSGALGDRYGRWTLFVVGVAGFAAASAVAGIAPNVELLIAGRVLQGVAGALLTTNSLALLRATYGDDAGKAVGQWTAWSGIGTMIGPPLGGLLIQVASWRWIFFLNLPFAALALVMAFAGRSEEDRTAKPRPLQLPGAVGIAVTFGGVTYGLIDGGQSGFGSSWPWFLVALVGFAVLVISERRADEPLLPPELLRKRVFVVANVYTFLVYAALGSSTFYLALYLQSQAVGYTPARASLIFLPISVVMFFLAARFGRLADRDGPRRLLAVAPIVMAVGFVLLTFVQSMNPLVPLPGVLVLAFGLADARRPDHGDRPQGGSRPLRRACRRRQHHRLAYRRPDRDPDSRRRDHARLRRRRPALEPGSVRDPRPLAGRSRRHHHRVPGRDGRRGRALRRRVAPGSARPAVRGRGGRRRLRPGT